MAEQSISRRRARPVRHRGFFGQFAIYFGKLARSFITMKDYKVLPMAAVIAALLSMVVRNGFFTTMEGTLKGSFALTCVGIWNGCFNSIQVICRERPIVKREHRSGMRIGAYVAAHMAYQALLCIAQTAITLYVCRAAGIRFPEKGLITPWMIADVGITVLLISYASDLLSLFVSSLAHNTTAAMTVMPFLLIFQLTFAGGFFTLPDWARPVSNLTISHYGMETLMQQADYNNLTTTTAWTTVEKMKNEEFELNVSVGEVLEALQDGSSEMVSRLRSQMVYENLTLGDIVDIVAHSPEVIGQKTHSIRQKLRVSDLLELVGEDRVRTVLEERSSRAAYNADYTLTPEKVIGNWAILLVFALAAGLFTRISLAFIDRDRR